MRKKKLFGLALGLVFSMAIFSGCGSSKSNVAQTYGEAAEIKIAVLGSAEQFTKRQDFLIGMDLAVKELEAKNVKISYEKIDDGHSRDSGVALAKDVANDSNYTAAFTLQNSDVVESITAIFEEAKKPLLIVNEVFDSTMKGLEYVLAGVISAEAGGQALAKYCEANGIKWVATAHSDSPYEKMFARGFNDAAMNSKSIHLVDSTSGPDNASEFADMYARWSVLGVQAALVSFDDLEWACEVISNIKAQNKDILILGDAKYYDVEAMSAYKDVLEGIVVAGSSGVAYEEKLKEFYDKYEAKFLKEQNILIGTVTAQAYDFVHMIAQNVKKSANVQEFMKNMKSAEGYAGVTGVKFNSKGQLEEEPNYWTVRDAQMYRMT